MPVPRIAEVTCTSPDRVRDVIHNFDADGFDALYPGNRGGRPATFSTEQRQLGMSGVSCPTTLDVSVVFASSLSESGTIDGSGGQLTQSPASASTDADVVCPVEYLVVEFPSGQVSAAGFDTLLDLVARDVIRVLDLEFVTKSRDGIVTLVDLSAAVSGASGDLSAFLGASSLLLDQDDLARAGALLEPGSLAGILVYENVWATGMLSAMRRGGARIVSSGKVDPDDLEAALSAVSP